MPFPPKTFDVNIMPGTIPGDSCINRSLTNSAGNLGDFLKDLDRLSEVYIGGSDHNYSLLSLRGKLSDATTRFEGILEPGEEKNAAQSLMGTLSVEKENGERAALEAFRVVWACAFSTQELVDFFVELPEEKRNKIITAMRKNNSSIIFPDMREINVLQDSIIVLQKTDKNHRGATVEEMLDDLRTILEGRIGSATSLMMENYKVWNESEKKQFEMALVNMMMPQAFSEFSLAVLKDILKPPVKGTHFSPNNTCSKDSYSFNSSVGSSVVDVTLYQEIYAMMFLPVSSDPLAEQKEPHCKPVMISGTKRAPSYGDYKLFKDGAELWVDSEEFKKIKEKQFEGYDRILTIETKQEAYSLRSATPVSVKVTQHVNIALDQRFLNKSDSGYTSRGPSPVIISRPQPSSDLDGEKKVSPEVHPKLKPGK